MQVPRFYSKIPGLTSMNRAVAIGEVGMDYTHRVPKCTIQKQNHLLEEVASEVSGLNKPLVVHCSGGHEERSATLDCFTILREVLPK